MIELDRIARYCENYVDFRGKYKIDEITGYVIADCEVSIFDTENTELPIQFQYCKGFSLGRGSKFVSLKGSPFTCDGEFDVTWAQGLDSFVGLPKKITTNLVLPESNAFTAYDYRVWLLCRIHGDIFISENYLKNETKIEKILQVGRIDGVMPSELIPGKIKELKESDND